MRSRNRQITLLLALLGLATACAADATLDEAASTTAALQQVPECAQWLSRVDDDVHKASDALREQVAREARGRREALTRLASNPAARPGLAEHCRKLLAHKR